MDLDGDGVLSMYELEYFYEEQQQRMESIGIETLPFEDCLCQMLDMIKPVEPGCITLGDLKRCRMTPIFFDTFFNLEKYMEHEQRDPFASQRDQEDVSNTFLFHVILNLLIHNCRLCYNMSRFVRELDNSANLLLVLVFLVANIICWTENQLPKKKTNLILNEKSFAFFTFR